VTMDSPAEAATPASGPIPMARWGKDHWSTLAYIETRIVDHKGVPNRDHMRTDASVHPGLTGSAARVLGLSTRKYPTRLNDGALVAAHDDWSCLDDAEAAGLLESGGTGIHPVYRLTPLGAQVCAALRLHKPNGSFGTFRWPVP